MIAAALLIAATACPIADPRSALLAVHESARQAHLTGNAELLAASADDAVIMADGGAVRRQTRDGIRTFFTGYFKRVRYSEWRDQAPPAIMVSPDGNIAWMAVAIDAKISQAGQTPDQRFKSSWIATYRRNGCDWKMTGMASNVVR